MDHLARFTGTNVDKLRQVDLERAGVITESDVEGGQDGRVSDQGARGGRASDECADAASPVTQEVSIPAVRSVQKWFDFDQDLVHHFGRDQIRDDDAAFLTHDLRNVARSGICVHRCCVGRHVAYGTWR